MQDLLDDFVLPDDDLAQLGEDPLAAFGDAFCARDSVHRSPCAAAEADIGGLRPPGQP